MFEERKPGHFFEEMGGLVTYGRITDEEGKVVGDNIEGTIEIKAKPGEEEAFAFTVDGEGFVNKDGYIPTNKTGIVDSDGFLTVLWEKSKSEGRSR